MSESERTIERFNKICRNEVRDAYLFEGLEDARRLTEEWNEDFSERRPHDTLNGLPPKMYREMTNRELMLDEVST